MGARTPGEGRIDQVPGKVSLNYLAKWALIEYSGLNENKNRMLADNIQNSDGDDTQLYYGNTSVNMLVGNSFTKLLMEQL